MIVNWPIRFLSSILVIGLAAMLTAFSTVRSAYRRAAYDICDLVDTHYYRSDDNDVQAWLSACVARAGGQSVLMSRDEVIKEINSVLETLDVSHLFLYTPVENRAIWDHEAVDTGIRARMVDGFLVVHELIKGGGGEQAGIRRGDVLKAINGKQPGSSEDVEKVAGLYTVSRQGEELKIAIEAAPLHVDLGPSVESVGGGTGRLRIQSFIARYFERDDWKNVARSLSLFRHLIIDLRGNVGGSFPAMLRALSTFHCEPKIIGTIYQPKEARGEKKLDLVDELDTDSQLEQLKGAAELHLKTFAGYPCFSGKATVLVDQDTSSVAEIFAESFFSRPNSRVWGTPTAGQVVMAQWFPVSGLGGGDYSVSIPIAGYRTARGFEIEAEGIPPERLLYYDLERSARGRDPWIEEAASR